MMRLNHFDVVDDDDLSCCRYCWRYLGDGCCGCDCY